MKKLIALILCILMVIPTFAFGAPSPTLQSLRPTTNPEIMFVYASKLPEWEEILKRIELIPEVTKGFTMVEALQISLDKPYEKVTWTLAAKFTSEYEPFMLMINDEAIEKRDVSIDSDGALVTDFSEFEPGIYILCFYVKEGVK